MKYWRDNGTPVEKLMMGFATYGRTFRLSSSNTGVGAPASGAASAGPYTREAGFWSYYEVESPPITSGCVILHWHLGVCVMRLDSEAAQT